VLCEVEEQDFGVLLAFDGQLLFVADRCAIALVQLLAIQLDSAAGDLQPSVTALWELVSDFFSGLEKGDE
jgi:hypothetical protein